MARRKAAPKLDLSRGEWLDAAAARLQVDREALEERACKALQKAAHEAFGGLRNLDVYVSDEGELQLFVVMMVTDPVAHPEVELSLAAARDIAPDVQPGEELMFQIFFRDDQQAQADEQQRQYGAVLAGEDFAAGLAAFRASYGQVLLAVVAS